MATYIPPYKLSIKRTNVQSDQGNSVEGIQAFLSRVQKARQDADQKEDLALQEKITRGEISIDEQIDSNKRRQERFVPTSKEYQQLNNNIAELQTARKWESFSLMEAQNINNKEQLGYLKNWMSSVAGDSELANKISEKIGMVSVQIAREEYRSEWEAQKTEFEQGRIQRKNLISYLTGKLSSSTDDEMKADIQAQINTQNTALLQDADNLRNNMISSFDAKGDADNEGKLLGFFEDDYQKDLSDGDAASAIARKGDIDSQKKRLVSLTIQNQLDDAFSELLEHQDIAGNQNYLSALQGLAQKTAMDFSYKGINGETKTLHIDDVGEYTQINGKSLRQELGDTVNKFITQSYIPDYAASLKDEFLKEKSTAGTTYETIKNKATSLLSQWSLFSNQDAVKPFALTINQNFNAMQGSMVEGMLTALGNKFSSGDASDVDTVRAFEEIQGMFPTMSGTEFEQYAIGVKQQIGRANFEKFQGETFGEIDKRISDAQAKQAQIKAASTQLNFLSQNDVNKSSVYLDRSNQLLKADAALAKDIEKLTQEKTAFSNKYAGDRKLYQSFVPNATTGTYAKPEYALSATTALPSWFPEIQKQTEGYIGKVAKQEGVNLGKPPSGATTTAGKLKATSQYQIKIPNATILRTKYKAGEYEFNPKDRTTYLKVGVEKRF